MFNDQIAVMFIAIAIYYLCVKEKVVISSMFLGFAWTIKAPTSLILPAFLGSIQYNFGTIALVSSLNTILLI